MAAQPEENKPLRSEDSDDDANNPAQQAVVADVAKQQPAGSVQPEQGRDKDAQDYAQEVGTACNKCYNWFPIGIFGWIGGWVLVACCIIDIFNTALTFTQFFVCALLICGGLVMVLVEMPSAIVRKQRILQMIQLAVYEWLKLLSRMWGRATYCCVLVIMCFSEMGGGFRAIPWVAGMYFSVLVVFYLIFGLLAAKKYNGLYIYITNREINVNVDVDLEVHVDENKDEEQKQEVITDDGDILKQTFVYTFDEIDENKDGIIEGKDIARLAVKANLELSNSECHAIVCYLDNDCKGAISKDDWVRMWMENSRLIWL